MAEQLAWNFLLYVRVTSDGEIFHRSRRTYGSTVGTPPWDIYVIDAFPQEKKKIQLKLLALQLTHVKSWLLEKRPIRIIHNDSGQ